MFVPAEALGGDTLSLDSLPTRPVSYPAGFQSKSRRTSVSAESDHHHHSLDAHHPLPKKFVAKTTEAMERIRKAIAKSILFTGLDEQQTQDIVNAMEEMKVAPGEVVIRQFQEGDYFYVIDSGRFDVFKKSNPAEVTSEHDGLGKQVFQYSAGGSFGELALMYNTPRAASVRCSYENATDADAADSSSSTSSSSSSSSSPSSSSSSPSSGGVLWRVDRETFRTIIVESNILKRKRYEQFLESIPLLSTLNKHERSQIADCLETVQFDAGEMILKQGDEDADKLYLILEGKAKATQLPSSSMHNKSAVPVDVGHLSAGQYFGERSLLTREPRAANVVALSKMTCAVMDRSGFERLLGPLKDIMKLHAAKYIKAEQVIQQQQNKQQ